MNIIIYMRSGDFICSLTKKLGKEKEERLIYLLHNCFILLQYLLPLHQLLLAGKQQYYLVSHYKCGQSDFTGTFLLLI